MHYHANQQYFIAQAKVKKAVTEMDKFKQLDEMRKRAFGRVLACLIKKVEYKKRFRATTLALVNNLARVRALAQ